MDTYGDLLYNVLQNVPDVDPQDLSDIQYAFNQLDSEQSVTRSWQLPGTSNPNFEFISVKTIDLNMAILGTGSPAADLSSLGDLTGTVICDPPVQIGSDYASIAGAQAGIPEFWISSITGTAVFAAGLATIGATGINLNGLQFPITHSAIYGVESRTGSIGAWLMPDG